MPETYGLKVMIYYMENWRVNNWKEGNISAKYTMSQGALQNEIDDKIKLK